MLARARGTFLASTQWYYFAVLRDNPDYQPETEKRSGPESVFELNRLRHLPITTREGLLEAAYPGYARAFPFASERLTLEGLTDLITLPEFSAWDSLLLTQEDRMVGGSVFGLIDGGALKFGIQAYVWVEPEFQGNRVADYLLQTVSDAVLQFGGQYLMGELADPSVMTESEIEEDSRGGISPEKRIQYWKKRDRLLVDAPYLLPSLAGGDVFDPAAASYHYLWNIAPLAPQFKVDALSRTDYLNALEAYWSSFLPPTLVRGAREFLEAHLHDETIPLAPLDAVRTHVGRGIWPPRVD